jgi:hypothetical protein
MVSDRTGCGERLSRARPHNVKNKLSSTGVKLGRVMVMFFPSLPGVVAT